MRYLMNHGSLAELRDRIYHKKKGSNMVLAIGLMTIKFIEEFYCSFRSDQGGVMTVQFHT